MIQVEAAGRTGSRGLADRADHVPLDCCPAALGALIDIDLMLFLVDEDQIAGAAAVALGLFVHAGSISDRTVSADPVTVDRCVGRDSSIGLDIVHGIADEEPALGPALCEINGREEIQFSADPQKAGSSQSALVGIKIIELVSNLSLAGQDLSITLGAVYIAGEIRMAVKFEPASAKLSIGVKSISFSADPVDAFLVGFAVNIKHVAGTGFYPAVFGCLSRHVRSRAGGICGNSSCHDRHGGQDHNQYKQ